MRRRLHSLVSISFAPGTQGSAESPLQPWSVSEVGIRLHWPVLLRSRPAPGRGHSGWSGPGQAAKRRGASLATFGRSLARCVSLVCSALGPAPRPRSKSACVFSPASRGAVHPSVAPVAAGRWRVCLEGSRPRRRPANGRVVRQRQRGVTGARPGACGRTCHAECELGGAVLPWPVTAATVQKGPSAEEKLAPADSDRIVINVGGRLYETFVGAVAVLQQRQCADASSAATLLKVLACALVLHSPHDALCAVSTPRRFLASCSRHGVVACRNASSPPTQGPQRQPARQHHRPLLL